jgi:flagellar biosynthesis anti-sigma factor FlgM
MSGTIYSTTDKTSAVSSTKTADNRSTTSKAQVDHASVSETSGTEELVKLSANVQADIDKALFDQEKVDRVKDALRNGDYPLDSKKIANSFIDLEKLI